MQFAHNGSYKGSIPFGLIISRAPRRGPAKRQCRRFANSSLRKLGKDYNVDVLKGYFPYTFINNNNLEYIGEKPNYHYYKTGGALRRPPLKTYIL